MRVGAERAGKTLADVDCPELIVCALSDENPAAAMDEGRRLVANYLAMEPHIMKASGVDQSLIDSVQKVLGYPPTRDGYDAAMKLIPDDVVRNLMAVGTTHECQEKVQQYIAAGVTCPILYPLMDDIKPVVDAFARW